MTWLDVVCILLVLLIVVFESWQGITRSTITLIGIYLGGKLCHFLTQRVITINMQGSGEVTSSPLLIFISIFLFVVGFSLLAAFLIDEVAQFHLEEMERTIALPINILVAITFVHWVLEGFVLAYPEGTKFYELLENSPVAKELFTLEASKKAASHLFQWSPSP